MPFRLLSPALLVIVSACAGDARAPEPPLQPTPSAPGAPVGPTLAKFENPGGMWTPRQLGSAAHAGTLRRLGLGLDPAQLSDPMAFPLGAVVSLGGCSASFVSPLALIITNHHCVTGALQYNSTPEKNLLENGYLAKKREDELSVGPTGRVFVTKAFTDVTGRVREGIEDVTGDKARHDLMERREKEIVAECEKEKRDVRCEVAAFFGAAQYLLVESLEIKDIRLVYAPPRGIGNFGGEVDNWRWPRHTGDFAFYRAYVGADGMPAEHTATNVPFRPRHHLRVAREPLSADDLVLVAGYPRRTFRLQTGDEAEEAVSFDYPFRIQQAVEYLATIERLKQGDAELAIKATPLERGLSNRLTYMRGALEGLSRGGAAEERRERDRQLERWIFAEARTKVQYGDVFSQLRAVFAQRRETREIDYALDEALGMPSLVGAAFAIVRLAEERPKPDAERDPEYQERNWEELEQAQRALEKRYSRKLNTGLLEQAALRARRLGPDQRALVLRPLTGTADPTPEQITAAVGRLFAGTRLENTEERLRLLRTGSIARLRASKDPLLSYALALRPLHKSREDRDDARRGRLALLRPRYVAALRELSSEPVAPDANGTLRVTYGTVRGYRPKPGMSTYLPFTVLAGVAEKSTGKEPFDAPRALLDAHRARRFGPWGDPRLGDIPVNFLGDLDITGGNSGSPTLNGRGELVGLAFDGNYEAMASDWVFMPDLTRSIHVDIRYALWVMDAVDGADSLMQELGVEPGVP